MTDTPANPFTRDNVLSALSAAQIEALTSGLRQDELATMIALMDELEERKRIDLCQNDFLAFIAAVDKGYKFGAHLKKLGHLLEDVEVGIKDRIAVSMGPRFGKSQMISIYFPAWYLGRHPDHKIIVASHTSDLAVVMARKVRNLMQTAEYKAIFPNVRIAADAKAAGQWNTNQGGEFYASGVGGALAGRGCHLAIVDDPISEQMLKSGDFSGLDTVYEWFTAGLRTRLMPGGKICVLHTRWHQRDLIGRLIKDTQINEDGDQYEIFEFPVILEVPDPEDENKVILKSLWPEQWSLESLLKTKASMANALWQWNAQYMQNPTASESALIKREWIKWWEKDSPPSNIHTVVQSWDTALTAKQRSDYSYCTTWGVWDNEDGESHVILLNTLRAKLEFPELKKAAHEQWKEWQPDSLIIETKASGHSLVQELRRSGIFVNEYSPGKGQDKIARVNAISDMFASGHVWFPETAWAAALVEELVGFPTAEFDDGVDTTTLALMRIRQGGILPQTNDYNEDAQDDARRGSYY